MKREKHINRLKEELATNKTAISQLPPTEQYICYIIILDMFRAVLCSSSGGHIMLLQHLVSSLSVNSTPVESGLQSALNRRTIRPFTVIDVTRCCDNTI